MKAGTSNGLRSNCECSTWLTLYESSIHVRSSAKLLLEDSVTLRNTPPRLPNGLSMITVFADLLGHLFKDAELYIKQTLADGEMVWNQHILKQNIRFIVAHSNGWQGTVQKNIILDAAVCAGLILDTPDGRASIRFVDEGSAALQYCLQRLDYVYQVRLVRVRLLPFC